MARNGHVLLCVCVRRIVNRGSSRQSEDESGMSFKQMLDMFRFGMQAVLRTDMATKEVRHSISSCLAVEYRVKPLCSAALGELSHCSG
jgi:hypothetical protein